MASFGPLAIVLVLVATITQEALGHIGEPCNSLLRACLPPSPHIFCDSSNICRCQTEYPVEIQPHTCKKAKKVGDRCMHDRECSFNDANAFCNKAPFSSECQCIDGHRYNGVEGKCLKSELRSRNRSESFLPSFLGFFLASFAIFCCLLFFWHSFCQSPPRDWSENPYSRTSRSQIVTSARVMLPGGEVGSTNDDLVMMNSISRSSGQLPSYELSLCNQPPPSYEEAIKNDHSRSLLVQPPPEIILPSTSNDVSEPKEDPNENPTRQTANNGTN